MVNRDPVHGICISHRIPRAHGTVKGGKRKKRTSSKNYGRKERGHEGISPKQGLTSAEDVILMLHEGRDSPTSTKDQIKITSLTYRQSGPFNIKIV